MFGIIVVGTDGSLTADRAVARAAEIAAGTGDALHVVTAHKPGPEGASDSAGRPAPPGETSAAEDARATLRAAAALARQVGVEVATHARPGDPAKVILAVAGELRAGLVVVGSRGIERRIFGSVPSAVTHDASCDVLVVHTT